MSYRIQSLPYCSDSSLLFEKIADQEWAIFLDSGYPYIQQGRYDFLACCPSVTMITQSTSTTLSYQNGHQVVSQQDPFAIAQSLLPKDKQQLTDLPFEGGLMGYFSYDQGMSLAGISSRHEKLDDFPDVALGLYEWVLVVDHQEEKTVLVSLCSESISNDEWNQWIILFKQKNTSLEEDFYTYTDPISDLDYPNYLAAFDEIQNYLLQGDVYQVNLARHFKLTATGNAWQAYKVLRELNAAPFSAYMNTPYGQILSTSPERFIRVTSDLVETQPIKGTIGRSSDDKTDQILKDRLQHSEKDQAENLMIVDLLRNDLSKHCQLGSVKVKALFTIESYASVHHLVSSIEAQLEQDKPALQLLKGAFPGGSITGAPKIRAMQIIDELETCRRGIYCGSIGYIGANGNMDMNIAIRTLVFEQDTLHLYLGGGIVSDSQVHLEFEETIAKGKSLFAMIKRFRKN